jgi:hypothetical protein
MEAMTTKTLSECLRGWLLVASMLAAGCAPGSGGTGTGPTHSYTGFGATVVFAQTTGGSTGGDLPASGTGCISETAAVDLKLQERRIQLTTPCSTFTFEGDWSQERAGTLVVNGVYETPALGRVEPATLQVTFATGSAIVNVSVVDALGRVLVGPVVLQLAP